MKIKNLFIFTLLVTFLVAYSAYCGLTNTYDTSTPGGTDDPREADDRMREIKAAVQEFMNDHNGQTDEGDHFWPLTGTEVSNTAVGQHRMLTIRQLSGNPSALTSYATTTDLGFLYQKNVSGNGELFWEDEADNVIQLTSGGGLYSSTSGQVLGNFIVGVNKFVVGGASGNTTTEGTFNIQSTVALVGTLDDDTMATATDTTLATSESIKAYADNRSVNGSPTPVFTKYLTGTLDADSATTVAHGVASGLTNILAIHTEVFEDTSFVGYEVTAFKAIAAAGTSYTSYYDGTNVEFLTVGSQIQGNGYKIRIDYK